MTDRTEHWQAVYQHKAPDAVSWYTPHLTQALAQIEAAAPPPTPRILDVGAGASTLCRDLLDRGYARPGALDLSAAALAHAQGALGDRAADVEWYVGDVTTVALPAAAFDVWHDRAVFHFLTEAADRARYVAQIAHALRPGGHVVLATFALDGPLRCSGLPVERYDAARLQAALGPAFALRTEVHARHQTPWGSEQAFCHATLRFIG